MSNIKKQYVLVKDCWINGTYYKTHQLVQLTDMEAKEYLDKRRIKLTDTITASRANKAAIQKPNVEDTVETTTDKEVKTESK